jgi:hypothetical protein
LELGVAEQTGFRFAPLPGEGLNFGRMGLDLNWRRISRATRRLLRNELQTSAIAFAAGQYANEAAQLEEIRRQLRVRARAIRKTVGGRTRKPAAAAELWKSAEGRRAQLVIDRLADRLGKWEQSRKCG